MLQFIKIESCKDGLSHGREISVIEKYRKRLAAKEKEILYLRQHASSLDRQQHVVGLPTIYIITPTYTRMVQVRKVFVLLISYHSVIFIIPVDPIDRSHLNIYFETTF